MHKRLLAINEQTLESLGYSSLEEFKKEIYDIAQLFVKKPGYIHEFKSFHWIDYILTNSTVTHRAILKTKDGRQIETFININQLVGVYHATNYYLVTFELNTYNECITPEPTPQATSARPSPQPATEAPVQMASNRVKIEEKEFPPPNLTQIAEELNLSEDIVVDFIKEYINHALEKFDEIESFIKTGNKNALFNAIHTLKGVAANLRLKPAFEILSKAKKESSMDELIEIVKEFYSYIKFLAKSMGVEIDKELELTLPVTKAQPKPPQAAMQTSQPKEDRKSTPDQTPQQEEHKEPEIEEAANELGVSLEEYQEYLKELINEIKLNLAYNNYNELHKLASFARNLYLQECAKYLDQVNVNQNPELVKKCLRDLEEIKKEPNPFIVTLDDLKDSLELTQIDKNDFIEILEDLAIELKALNSIKMRKEKFLKKARQLKSVAESLRLSNLVLLLNNIISNYPMSEHIQHQLQEAIEAIEANIKQL